MARVHSGAPKSPSPFHPARAVALGLLVLATLSSAWLAYQSMQSGPVPGCEGGDCAAVLASKWAKVFGVPVALFGSAAYLVLAVLGFRPIPPGERGARIAGAALILLIPGAGLWFVGVQAFVLHAFCRWCCVTHAVATAGALSMALAWKRDRAEAAVQRKGQKHPVAVPPFWGAAASAAALAFGGFVLAQILGPEPPRPRVLTASMEPSRPPTNATATTASANPPIPLPAPAAAISNPPVPSVITTTTTITSTSPAEVIAPFEAKAPPASPAAVGADASASGPAPALSGRRVELHGGRFLLDPHDLPCVGSPDATHLMVMISDYTCVHCRHANRDLREVRQSFGADQLGTIMLPTQHGGDSLELQRIMLAAWRLDPRVWHEVATDIYEDRIPPRPPQVRPILEQRLGSERLGGMVLSNEVWFSRLITTTKEILAANREKTQSGSIPQFIIGSEIVVGSPADAAEIYQLLEKNFGLVRDRFPDFQLADAEIQLGRVFAGTTRTVSLAVSNAGQAPLQFARASLPAGGRTLAGFQTPIAPGATSLVQFALPMPVLPGPLDQRVTLFSNARTSQVPVYLKGTIWKPVQITPPLLDFGRLDPDLATTQGVMRIQFDEPARLASVRSQHAGFRADLREIEAGKVYEIDIATTSGLPAGVQQGTFLAELATPIPDGWPDRIAVAARAVVERAVTAMPNRIVVPKGALTTQRHHQVLVRCTDGTAGFKVTEAVLEDGPAFTLPTVTPAGAAGSFVVRLTLPAGWEVPTPPQQARLVVHTTHPRFPKVEIPLVVQGP